MIGMEAGQSAFGDAYAWFKNLIAWPLKNVLTHSPGINAGELEKIIPDATEKIISELSIHAEQVDVDENTELAVDWLNGRRTPDADQLLKGAVIGLDLGTDAPKMFRAIAEATCFGAKAIVDRFTEQGVTIKGLIGIGGVAKKSPYIMQMMADVMNMPIRIHKSEQTCAVGAAMFAATAAGIYRRVEDAMKAMGQGFDITYHPNAGKVKIYAKRFEKYKELGKFVENSRM
jgi:L-ribulokinase